MPVLHSFVFSYFLFKKKYKRKIPLFFAFDEFVHKRFFRKLNPRGDKDFLKRVKKNISANNSITQHLYVQVAKK